jgi:hypothetical protein
MTVMRASSTNMVGRAWSARAARLRDRQDAYEPTHATAIGKLDRTAREGEERVVLAAADVSTRLDRRPRWRTMIDPPETIWPSKRFTPRRCEFESRPFLELPPAFL